MSLHEARTQFLADAALLADKGVYLDGVVSYTTCSRRRPTGPFPRC